MRVNIGRRHDATINEIIGMNQSLGYTVYVEEHPQNENLDTFFIEILKENVWKAPSAVFRSIPSGTYVFKGDQIVYLGDEA